jgi:hypothetical protein
LFQKLGKATKVTPNLNTTKVSLDSIQKNLGVNGTGQRKNITIKPVLLGNETSAKIPVLQNITLTKNQTEDDDILSGDNFPPDEESEAFGKTLTEHHITNSTEVSC